MQYLVATIPTYIISIFQMTFLTYDRDRARLLSDRHGSRLYEVGGDFPFFSQQQSFFERVVNRTLYT